MAAQKTRKNVMTTALSARLLELNAETNDPQPYPVTETIVVQPPTRTRRTAMNNAEQKLFVLRGLLGSALNRSTVGPPVLVEDPTDEQREAFKVDQAEWLSMTSAAKVQADNLTDQIVSVTQDYERAFFGAAYDDVIEFFEDKPNLWDKFIPDIKAEFLPPAPDNGVCPACGRVDDEEAADRAPKSSTSSTTTGTPSN